MNESRSDGYLILAVCIAAASVFATSTQMFQIIQDFDNSAVVNLSLVAFALSQISLALAMLCAVIIGRNMIGQRSTARAEALNETTAKDLGGDGNDHPV